MNQQQARPTPAVWLMLAVAVISTLCGLAGIADMAIYTLVGLLAIAGGGMAGWEIIRWAMNSSGMRKLGH